MVSVGNRCDRSLGAGAPAERPVIEPRSGGLLALWRSVRRSLVQFVGAAVPVRDRRRSLLRLIT